MSLSTKQSTLCESLFPCDIECVDTMRVSNSLAARGGNLAKIPPNQVIDDFGRGSSVESESE